jgi:BioD-like phosphotransacetylase family protein
MRQVYLAATGQNRGKTTVALGLLELFRSRGLRTGFTKPVGQRTVIEGGVPADEDAVLMRAVFGLAEPLAAMSPVHIPRGFTKAYIRGEVTDDLAGRIRDALTTFAGHDIVLVEGTGHAGVGAVVGLSNATVAAMLGTPVVIVSEGGVGRPIDEIVLNAALFARHGVPVAGAVVNKVRLDLQPALPEILRQGLARHGIALLGVLPYRPILSNPTLEMVHEGIQGEVLALAPDMEAVIDGIRVAAMAANHVLERLTPGSLVIVSGDREDVIGVLVEARLAALRRGAKPVALGLVLTGGYRPAPATVEAIRCAGLFAVLVDDDAYTVASQIHDLLVKIHPADREKIEVIKGLVAEHLDVERILAITSPLGVTS